MKVSSSAVAKTVNRYDEVGSHEDCHRKGRPRVTSAAEDHFKRVNCEDKTTAYEMVWDESDRRVKEKQPTGAQHIWELLQECWKSIPGEAG